MPYGMPKEYGGDTKENDQWMETCIQKVMKQGKDQKTSIAICKSTFMKMKGNKSKASILIDFILDKL